MDEKLLSKIALFIAIVFLLGNALGISRDYQDSWILEGLEIPFVLFAITYAVAFFSEKKASRMVLLAIVGRIVFLWIPNLKYAWFQGTAIDQTRQYALANHVIDEGQIATESWGGYSNTPLMHLLFSIFSIILKMPVVDSMKYLPLMLSPIYPLLTYIIVEKMEFSKGKMILKYALFFSSIPFAFEHYFVTGTLFGILLAFLILTSLVLIFQKSDRRYWVVCSIFVFTLAASHSVTSVILAILLLIIVSIQKISYFRLKSYLRSSIALVVALIGGAWLMFQASPVLEVVVRLFLVSVPTGTTPPSEHIPPGFFEHIRVNILSAIKSFSVYFGADAFFLLLTLAGLMILLKRRKQLNSAAIFSLSWGWLALFLIVIGTVIQAGGPRSMQFERLLYPVFSSVFVLYLSKNTLGKTWIRPVIFTSIILLATIQLYRCQPLIPPANVLYKNLPSDVPLGYVGEVTSIYQRQMIVFAENHVYGIIACSSMTRNQIIGFTETSFWVENLARYYPLDKSQPERPYDYFLINPPGKSGIVPENPISRTPNLIFQTIYNSDVIYTNGESYVLGNRYPRR